MTHTRRRLPFRLLRILALLPAATATVAQGPIVRPPTVPLHQRVDAVDGPYGSWAAGENYKAEFSHGMRFVPMLGASHPQNEWLTWRTIGVAFGAADQPLATARATTPNDHRVEYDLGAVVEAYDVLPHGLEQTFVVAAIPATGDLVIRGAIASSLAPAPGVAATAEPTSRPLEFRDRRGRAIVRYGAATAIDARGRPQPMTTCFDGDVVELRLAAEWLATAELPLVVDPLIENLIVATDDVVATDIVRDPDGHPDDATWIAYQRAASAVDSDVVWLRVADDAGSTTLAYADITAAWSSEQPACAFVGHVGSAILVFTHAGPAGDRSIRWLVRGRTPAHPYSPETVIESPPGANDWRPDVGGALAGAPDRSALVVFQREQNGGPFENTETSLVVAQWLDVGANPAHAAWDQVVLGGGGFDNERPAINQTGEGTPDHAWLIAYQKYLAWPNPATATWRLELRKASRYGIVTPTTGIPNVPLRHDMAPQVAGSHGRFLVAFAAAEHAIVGSKPVLANGDAIRTLRVDWPGVAPWPSYPHDIEVVVASAAADRSLAGLSFDAGTRSHWFAAVQRTNPSQLDVVRVGHTGGLLGTDTLAVHPPGRSPARAAITLAADPGRHLVSHGAGGAGGDLRLATVALPAAAPQQVSGTSCSPAAIGWHGPQQIGAEFARVVVAGAEPTALHLMVVALAPQHLPLATVAPFGAGCNLLVAAAGSDFLGVLPAAFGAVAEWTLPLVEALPATTLQLQGVHTVGPSIELATTARLSVPIVR